MDNDNWKPKLFAIGTVVGAVVGLVTAVLLARAAEEESGSLEVSTADLLKASISVVSTMRGVAALGGAGK